MGYKGNFYARYLATHIVPRKGDITPEVLRFRAAQWRRTLARFLPPDRAAQIADLGCGYGSIVWWLQQEGYGNVLGVDISEEQVRLGERLGVRNLIHADVRQFLRTAPERFHLMFARDLLEHFGKPEIVEILELCRGALVPGGRVVIQVPNGESPFAGRILFGDFTHETAFTASSLAQILRMAGLEALAFYPVRPQPLSARTTIRVLIWRLIEAAYRVALLAEIGRVPVIVTQTLIAVAEKPHRT